MAALTDRLVQAAPELAVGLDREAIEHALAGGLARARAAWPRLHIADDVMLEAIAHAVRGAGDPAAAIAELALDDLYLAKACASGSAPALAAFAELCDPALVASLRSMGIAPDLVDELIQEVRTKLFVAIDGPPKIATYSGRAALKSWARTVATRTAVDRLRRKDASTDDGAVLEALPDATGGPELAYFRLTYRVEFKEAFEEALGTLDVRARNLLRHHHVDGLTVEEIGALYGVHKTTAFRWVEAARTSLSKRTRSAFQQRVRVLPADLESILQLLQSQIDLSLSRVLA